jgi:hypothetical protein
MSAANTLTGAAIVARVKALKAGATVADIDSIATAIRADLAAAEAEGKRLAAGRRAVLLSGDDEAAARHDALIAAVGRRADRAKLLLEELEPRRKAAAAREETARLDARKAEAAKVAKDLEAALAEYAEHAQAIAAILVRWKEGHTLIAQANEELRRAGRRDSIVAPETALRSKSAVQMPDEERTRMEWMIGDRPLGAHILVHDPRTGQMRPQDGSAVLREVREVVKGEFISAQQLPALADAVRLPPALIGAEPIWRGKS